MGRGKGKMVFSVVDVVGGIDRVANSGSHKAIGAL